MRSGKLRHRLELQENTPTRNAVGEEVDSWATIEKFWGNIEPLAGTELLHAQQTAAEVSHRISRRYASGVTPGHRILHGERVFDINAVINVEERGRELLLFCKEAV